MPTKVEKHAVTGRETTGHEWDGIKELNTPLPKWWLYVLYATIAWAAVWCVLYPSVPWVHGYFHGVLGYSQRDAVDADVRAVVAQRAATMDKVKTLSFVQIRQDPQLMAAAATAGRIAFANNCQPCHAAGGGGQPGYPALAAGAWIWGGTLEAIQQTITHGIRSVDPDARESAMPRFGADGILNPAEMQQVADYVMTLYGHPDSEASAVAGKKLFADNCAICHGAAGQGDREKGAPRLASHVHLYGDARAIVVAQVTMPAYGRDAELEHTPGCCDDQESGVVCSFARRW